MMMARKGLYKYRWQKHRSLIADLAAMSFAVFLAALAVFGAMKYGAADWVWSRLTDSGAAQEEALRGAAEEDTGAGAETRLGAADEAVSAELAETGGITPANRSDPLTVSDLSAQISVSGGGGYAYVGQKNVTLFSFDLTSPVSAHLKKIRFSVDGYSGSGDLTSIQLYYENKLAGQAPVSGAEAIFERMDIPLEPGQTASFTVKANVGEGARSGNRVNVGIIGAADLMLVDGSVLLGVDADFPLWGGLTSIIGHGLAPNT